jgi:hypothetical protein
VIAATLWQVPESSRNRAICTNCWRRGDSTPTSARPSPWPSRSPIPSGCTSPAADLARWNRGFFPPWTRSASTVYPLAGRSGRVSPQDAKSPAQVDPLVSAIRSRSARRCGRRSVAVPCSSRSSKDSRTTASNCWYPCPRRCRRTVQPSGGSVGRKRRVVIECNDGIWLANL